MAIETDDRSVESLAIKSINTPTVTPAKEAPKDIILGTEELNGDDVGEGYDVTFVENFAATMIQKVVRGSQARTELPAVCLLAFAFVRSYLDNFCLRVESDCFTLFATM